MVCEPEEEVEEARVLEFREQEVVGEGGQAPAIKIQTLDASLSAAADTEVKPSSWRFCFCSHR